VNRAMTLLSVAVIACSAFAGSARSSDVTVSATVDPSVVSLGSEAQLTITVQGKFRRSSEPELPPLDDFDVYDSGTSQNFSFINGQIQSSISYRYVLVPKKEGVFTIGPIRFAIKDKEYTTQPIQLEVVAASGAITPQTAPGSGQGEVAPDDDHAKKDQSIFIQASVDRDTVYVNQQVTWTLGYFSDGRITLLRSPNYTPPEAEGFWVEDLPPQNKYYTTLYGRQYLVNEIKRGYFPTSPGEFQIGPAKVDVTVDNFSLDRFDDFFSRSFRSRGFGTSQTLMTESQAITVLPIPRSGRPNGFNGVVAEDLTLSMAADKQVVQVGEPVNLTIELNGRGNIKTIAAPRLEGLDSFKVYESGSHSDVFKRSYVVTGRKKYDYVVIPKVRGKQVIPAIEIAYFDPVREEFRVARSHPVQLDVQPGAKEEGRKIIYAGAGDKFEVISQDIRFIHPVPSALSVSAGALPGGRTLLALQAIPLLAVVFSLAVEKRRRRLRYDVRYARSVRALREAEKKITAAKKLFRDGDDEKGFASVAAALFGYFADKMNSSQAGLTADAIESFLRGSGVGDDLAESVRRAIEMCDAARFGGASAGGRSGIDGLEFAARTSNMLRSLERGHLS
jgi:hypothetical protein